MPFAGVAFATKDGEFRFVLLEKQMPIIPAARRVINRVAFVADEEGHWLLILFLRLVKIEETIDNRIQGLIKRALRILCVSF